ncbi:MAG: acyl-CoA dehydrogenase family protein [Phototrophicaceae bacterium]
MLNEIEKVYAGFDLFKLDNFLTDSQRALRDRVRTYVNEVVRPKITPYWERAEFPWEIVMPMTELGIMGGLIRGWGSAGLDPLEVGLVTYEIAKGDGSVGTFFGVQSGLAMTSIGLLGSDEQRERWLPGLAKLEKIGAFGLTEPNVGSNARGIETMATLDGDHYVLNGAKRWIGNASMSDVLIIWARDEDGKLGAFVVEGAKDGVEGLTIEDIPYKIGKRAILNGDIKLENVRVPKENRLVKVSSFKDASTVLMMGRTGVAWEAAGAAAGAYELALQYTLEREQFGKPIASYQLIQQKLVEMATEVTAMQLICFQVAQLVGSRQIDEGIASMAKYNNARKARYVTQLAREVMGGNGLLADRHVARLMTDAEVIYTYEGTNEMNLLIVGRTLTGINAISS